MRAYAGVRQTIEGNRQRMISQLPHQATPPVATMPSEIIDATECVVASVLMDRTKLADVLGIIGGRDAIKDHRARLLFDAVLECDRQGLDADPVTVLGAVRLPEWLTRKQFESFVLNIAAKIPHADHAETYARILAEWNQRQRLAQLGQELAAAAADKSRPVDDIAASWAERLTQTAANAGGQAYPTTSLRELLAKQFPPKEFLVDGVIVRDQTLILTGAAKSFKTTTLCELAVSLAGRSPFLGRYEVPRAFRVGLFCGETSDEDLRAMLWRQLLWHGLEDSDCVDRIFVYSGQLPKLTDPRDIRAIGKVTRDLGLDFVALDPGYLRLAGVDMSQLTEVGPRIREIGAAVEPATLAILHHCKNGDARHGQSLSAYNGAGTGIIESGGQFLNINREREYRQGDQWHELNANWFGRGGHGGEALLRYDERTGEFEVGPLSASREDARQEEAAEKHSRAVNTARSKIRAAMNGSGPMSKSAIRDHSGQSGKVFSEAFGDMLREEEIAETTYTGKQKKTYTGYILAGSSTHEAG